LCEEGGKGPRRAKRARGRGESKKSVRAGLGGETATGEPGEDWANPQNNGAPSRPHRDAATTASR
jgi:hypothetical protein